MIEPRDLLGPCATLLAVVLAIFVFLFPRSLALFKEKLAALSEIDVPDSVKKQHRFTIFVFGDSLLLFVTSMSALLIGAGLLILLNQIAEVYVGSPVHSSDNILIDFRDTLRWLGIVFAVVFVCAVALFTNEVLIGERKLPILTKVYAKSVLGRKPVAADTENLLAEAKKLYDEGAFGQAVMYVMASLEGALKLRLGLPANVGFGRLIINAADELSAIVPREELVHIRKLRNIAAHPSPERRVTRKDAEQVLRLVENILQKLQVDSLEG